MNNTGPTHPRKQYEANRVRGSFSLPLTTTPRMRVYPKGTSCASAHGAFHRTYRAVAGQ